MTLQADLIVDIPAERVKFFGTTGKMLLPCPETVATLIEQCPSHQLITTSAKTPKVKDFTANLAQF